MFKDWYFWYVFQHERYIIYFIQKIPFLGEILDCGICQGLSSFIALQKDGKLTNTEIKDLSCESFPSKYYKKCTEMVDYYAISMINLIKQGSNENEICTKIGKCIENKGNQSYELVMDSHKTKRTLVGDNECTYGPSHWCSSKEVAKKCDVSFCVYYST